MSLAQWNRDFEAGLRTLPNSAWDEWLWESDMHDRLTAACMLNKSHLLGLLIARYRARYEPHLMRLRLGESLENMVHGSIMVHDLTLRQLRDATEDLQMHWKQYWIRDIDKASAALEALMIRFGDLNLAPGSPALQDDPASLDPERPGWMSLTAIRRFTSLFAVLHRHVHLASEAQELPPFGPNPDVQGFHVQAGLETFYEHSMLADLPPAARIIYKQDFMGMYHCVSQVVFMQFPNYERRRQVSLEEVRMGGDTMGTLSSALQLRPDAKLVYEDDQIDPTAWTWVLLSGGCVYLVGPGRDEIYTGGIWSILAKFNGLEGDS